MTALAPDCSTFTFALAGSQNDLRMRLERQPSQSLRPAERTKSRCEIIGAGRILVRVEKILRLDRRIDDPKRLRREIAAWERKRNAARPRIKWMFTTDKARAKMGRAWPATAKES
ncbi:hypothetical protein ACVIYL_004813 [Bradyrhizobium sp. USDA 3315]